MYKKMKKSFLLFLSVMLAAGCILPSLSVVSAAQEQAYALTDWQSMIPDELPISLVNTPGTHDSAAYNMTPLTMGFSQCQKKTVSEQFDCGVRYFDFRFTFTEGRGDSDADALTLCHSFIPCIKEGRNPSLFSKKENYIDIEDMVAECSGLLEKHPTEYIIFSYHYDVGSEEKYGEWNVNQRLNKYFSSLAENDSDRYYFIEQSTPPPQIFEVRGKVIFCLCNWSGWIKDEMAVTNRWGKGILDKIRDLRDVGFSIEKKQSIFLPPEDVNPRLLHLSTYSIFPVFNPLFCSFSINNWFLGKAPFNSFFGIPSPKLKKGNFYGWFLFDFVNSELSRKVIDLNITDTQNPDR